MTKNRQTKAVPVAALAAGAVVLTAKKRKS